MTPKERRTIRVFPDWGAEWPLWENGHPDYNTTPEEYGLSPELSIRIRRWMDDWEAGLDIDSDPPAWRGETSERTWIEEGCRICEAIGWEVMPFADVVYELGNPVD